MSSKYSPYFMFSHRKLVDIPVSAMRGFASLLIIIHVRQSKWGCRDLRSDGSGEVRSFEILRQCLSSFILGFFLTGTTKKVEKYFTPFLKHAYVILEKIRAWMFSPLMWLTVYWGNAKGGTVTRTFGPSGKMMDKMHNEELNDYYFWHILLTWSNSMWWHGLGRAAWRRGRR